MEHENLTDYSFNDITGSQLAIFFLDVFIRAYGLKPIRQPLDADFVRASKTRFNFVEMLKLWMSEPGKFSQRKDDLYPISRFKEPYFLLADMLCRLYALPNCSIFKDEWAPVAHHVLTTSESFPWASVLSLELKVEIHSYQKATAWKKPIFFFFSLHHRCILHSFSMSQFGMELDFTVPTSTYLLFRVVGYQLCN